MKVYIYVYQFIIGFCVENIAEVFEADIEHIVISGYEGIYIYVYTYIIGFCVENTVKVFEADI